MIKMPELGKGLFQNLFRRHKKSGDGTAQKNPQNDCITEELLPTSSSQSSIEPAPNQTFIPLDLWKTAYDQLDDEDQRILLTVRTPINLDAVGNHSRTNVLISEVIQVTEEQYGKYQQKPNGNLRSSCQKIINAALSFKDIISSVAAFDPTHHAASAWAIVSLGLTVCNSRQQSMKIS
jgi:hypothetical protein